MTYFLRKLLLHAEEKKRWEDIDTLKSLGLIELEDAAKEAIKTNGSEGIFDFIWHVEGAPIEMLVNGLIELGSDYHIHRVLVASASCRNWQGKNRDAIARYVDEHKDEVIAIMEQCVKQFSQLSFFFNEKFDLNSDDDLTTVMNRYAADQQMQLLDGMASKCKAIKEKSAEETKPEEVVELTTITEEDELLFALLLIRLCKGDYEGILEKYDEFKVLLQSDDRSKDKDSGRLRTPPSN